MEHRAEGSPRPFRLALIGCGRIAQAHLEAGRRVAERVPGGPLQWHQVVDRRPEAARANAEQLGCAWSTDYRDAAWVETLDGVVVCTPPDTHFEISRYFLERDVPVLCEKPLVLELDQARQLTTLAANRGLTLMMASKFRYVEDLIRAKALIEAGTIGRPILYRNGFVSRVAMGGRWNTVPEVSGGGVLIDNGTHSIDIARYLLGPIRRVQAELLSEGGAVEHSARVLFRTARGVLGGIDLSWAADDPTPYFVEVNGTEGELQIGWGGSRFRRENDSDWKSFGSGYDKFRALGDQLINFAGCVRGADEPAIGPSDAVASVETIAAAYESARCGAAVELPTADLPTADLPTTKADEVS